MTMTTDVAYTVRSFLLRLAAAFTIVLLSGLLARAGGPKNVAGTSYFDPSTTGKPLVWPQGTITYYTDQSDLSPILPNGAANSLVADAFGQWTSVPTAAITAAAAGQLAEDVNGANVIVNGDGTISMPPDTQSTAIGTPVSIVYDYDGSVTDALVGAGAGDSSECFVNAAFGGNDNYGIFATYQHALIVINGQCAQQSSQLSDVEYRLVRTIGSVLGVGWSQLNLNVITGVPYPTSDDYAGFPVMHYGDRLNCIPITRCYPNPYQLSADDAASISRLYPVTAQNVTSGKQIFSSTTGHLHGSVWFTNRTGGSTQPMQGVNVVARWIDPSTGQPSRRYAVSCVSGFLYNGNEGNPITGLDDDLGNPYSEWGSTQDSLEGFFDLAGLPLPNGSPAQYQLTVEGLDPNWSVGVGPLAPWQVAPSGSSRTILVPVAASQDVRQDILMSNSAQALNQPATSWSVPRQIPPGGDWVGVLDGSSEVHYFAIAAQANRTLSVAVTALDESGRASESKLMPVIGMWTASDPEGTPPPTFTPSAFNSPTPGMTRLDTQVSASGNFLIGISDFRGDGRLDYRYRAHVLYGDSAAPRRVGVNGGPVTIQGIGFGPGLNVSLNGMTLPQLANNTGQLIVSAPAMADGLRSLTITDPVSGAFSVMTNVLTYGAAASDNIVLLGFVNPSTPVGAQAPRPMLVRVFATDGETPVAGATVGWSGTNAVQLSLCHGASSCSSVTNENGDSLTWLTPGAKGNAVITATLAPGAYSPPKSVAASVNGIQSSSDIAVVHPYVFPAQGATLSFPVTARVVSNGTPRSGATVNFTIVNGSGRLSASSAQTDSNGYATVALSVTNISSLVQVSACVGPGNAPCDPLYATPVSPSQWNLQPVAGAGQIVSGQAFQPVVIRVVDSASPPNPVLGATVAAQTTVFRPGGSPPTGGDGETNPDNPAMPVILSVSRVTGVSDVDGLISLVPTTAGFSAPVSVDVQVTAGSAMLDYLLYSVPVPPLKNSVEGGNQRVAHPVQWLPRPMRNE
jgi:hypothetical protein